MWFGMLKLQEGRCPLERKRDSFGRFNQRRSTKSKRSNRQQVYAPERRGKNVAESVGISAIRYADLVQNPQTDVQFSWDKLCH